MQEQSGPDQQDEDASSPPPGVEAAALPLSGMSRAQLLFETRRFADAEKELRRQLGLDPHNPQLHVNLSLTLTELQRHVEATREAEIAIQLDPDMPGAFQALARSLAERNRTDEGLRAVAEALRLAPFDALNHATKAFLLWNRSDWAGTLDAANQGLALDPEHDGCRNLRAMALRQLGRRDEAAATIRDQLRKSPDDAFTHANQGWGLLHSGDYAKALEHFREALRLDPSLDYAREGILEALKARNPIYRVLLRWKIWMSRLSGGAQLGIVIGLYVLYRVGLSTTQSRPELALFIWPLLGLYLGFVLLTWAGDPFFDSILRLSRFGRLSLTTNRRYASNLLLGGLSLLPIAGALWFLTGDWEWILPAVGLSLVVLVGTKIFFLEAGWPRWILAAVLLVLTGIVLVAWLPLGPRSIEGDPLYSRFWTSMSGYGLLAAWILVNVLIGVRPKR